MFSKIKIQEKIKLLSDIRVIGLLAFGVVSLLVTWSTMNVLQTNYELQKKQNELRQKNQLQKLANENLKLENTYFNSDEYLELTARRQFNKALPGEKLYLIPKTVAMSKTVNLPKTEKQEQQEKEKSKPKYQQNLQAWHKFFFHN